MTRLKTALLALVLALAAQAQTPLMAAQLVMFDSKYCPFCMQWKKDIGVFYYKTDEGRAAPLRPVDIDEERPKDLKNIKGIHYTPTFVLVDDNGREVGRIEGYNNDEFFFFRLDQLIAKMKKTNGKTPTDRGNAR